MQKNRFVSLFVPMLAAVVITGVVQAAPIAAAANPTTAAAAPVATNKTKNREGSVSARISSVADATSSSGSASSRQRRRQLTLSEYWTPARQKAAKPLGQFASTRPQGAAPAVKRPTAVSSGARTQVDTGGLVLQEPYPIAAEKTIGKLYSTSASGNDYSCSASVVTSSRRNLILTAGHCVFQVGAGFSHNIVFIPAYDYGSKPYGQWTVVWATTTGPYATSGSIENDFAFGVVAPLNGQEIQDVVGANGIAWNQSEDEFAAQSMGYQRATADGERLVYCGDTVRQETVPAYERGPHLLGHYCGMSPGASGGPIFRWLNGVRYIATITRGGTTKWIWGIKVDYNTMPYFGDNLGGLYATVR
jgi:V8-like Glu-specific endopeptidase